MNLPLTFRGIVRLAKKHKVKLTPGNVVHDYKEFGCGCALTVLAVENNLEATSDVRYMSCKESGQPDFEIKVRAIECGFENWGDRWGESLDNKYLFYRYYQIGQKLRVYAGY